MPFASTLPYPISAALEVGRVNSAPKMVRCLLFAETESGRLSKRSPVHQPRRSLLLASPSPCLSFSRRQGRQPNRVYPTEVLMGHDGFPHSETDQRQSGHDSDIYADVFRFR